MTSLTVRLMPAGSVYYDGRRDRLVHVPSTHDALVCEACHWAVHMPTRLGRDRLEVALRQHLKTAHLTDLLTGRVVLTAPEDLTLSASRPRRRAS